MRLRSRLQLLKEVKLRRLRAPERTDMTEQLESTPAVVETLLANHRQFLSFLERRVESREVAEDILQEAFVRGLDSDSLREAESAIGWFYRSLRNAIIDHYRRRGTEARVLEQLASETDDRVFPDEELMDEVCACVNRLISTLKPEYANAIRRVELDEVSVRDYAKEQAMSPNAAGVRLFRAREALKRRLIESCGSCSEHGCLDCSCSIKC